MLISIIKAAPIKLLCLFILEISYVIKKAVDRVVVKEDDFYLQEKPRKSKKLKTLVFKNSDFIRNENAEKNLTIFVNRINSY